MRVGRWVQEIASSAASGKGLRCLEARAQDLHEIRSVHDIASSPSLYFRQLFLFHLQYHLYRAPTRLSTCSNHGLVSVLHANVTMVSMRSCQADISSKREAYP